MSEESCFAKFRKEIPQFLATKDMSTSEITKKLGIKFPHCVSDKPYSWNGGKSGLEWKHTVREALDYLRRNSAIEERNKKWLPRYQTSEGNNREENEMLLEARNSRLSRKAIADQLRQITPSSSNYVEYRGKRISRDIDTIAKLKLLREYKCQICGTSIKKKGGGLYIEGAHITPKRRSGPEIPENILILCPNHHKEFDYGDKVVLIRSKELIRFRLNGITYTLSLIF
jgi:predicted restriction endonuclease